MIIFSTLKENRKIKDSWEDEEEDNAGPVKESWEDEEEVKESWEDEEKRSCFKYSAKI